MLTSPAGRPAPQIRSSCHRRQVDRPALPRRNVKAGSGAATKQSGRRSVGQYPWHYAGTRY
uniref:Uncharacterized protein n=1 Tax=Oryza barthii TaxID=65489 RepID=A0A0D3HM54_9ORYZ